MHPVVRGAATAGGFGLLTALVPGSPMTDGPGRPDDPSSPTAAASTQGGRASANAASQVEGAPTTLRCSSGYLPDLDLAAGRASCIPIPEDGRALGPARSRRLASGAAGRVRLPTSAAEQRIPRLPNRPEAYQAYRLPAAAVGPVMTAGPSAAGDDLLDDPASASPWGETAHVGVRIETQEQAPVMVATLEKQQSAAQVLLVGELYGVTVATSHQVQTPAGLRSYVVFYGHLDRPGPRVVNGAELGPESVVGFAGDADGSQTPHVYLEVRQLRHAADPNPRYLSTLASSANSIPTDPRNVLEIR